MTFQMGRERLAIALALLGGALAGASAQASGGKTTAAVVVNVGGTHFEAQGAAECRAATDGSIYDVPASMWHASFSDARNPLSRVNVTIWQPAKGGSSLVTLFVTARAASYEIATVPGGRIAGSATGRVERAGAGAVLSVDGTTAMGQAIRVRLSCTQFLPAEDNG